MEKVTLAEIDPIDSPLDAAVYKPLSPFLGTEDVSLNYYELEPGDQFGFAMHTHHDQEEVFFIQEGTATFETRDGAIDVGEGEMIRFAPGDFQIGRNGGDVRVSAITLGAPKDSSEVEYFRECETCGDRTEQRAEREENGLAIRCETCREITHRITFE